jgi:hypothetical protein
VKIGQSRRSSSSTLEHSYPSSQHHVRFPGGRQAVDNRAYPEPANGRATSPAAGAARGG